MCTRVKLAEIANREALRPFHGYLPNNESNIQPIVDFFPKWNIKQADSNWCAGFVYYCCIESGFLIPYSPNECITCSLAGCGGWEEFATGDKRIGYYRSGDGNFIPSAGDIVLYDRVFNNNEHDHIGIVVCANELTITVAEGNINNVSEIIERKIDPHIRAYIRIPDNFVYTAV